MYPNQIAFDAIGTRWIIDFDEDFLPEKHTTLQDSINKVVASFDELYSRFRSDSIVSKIAQKSGIYPISRDGVVLLDLYKKLYTITEGAFTPLIGNVLSNAGYDASYSFQSQELSHPPAWEDVLEYTSREIKVKHPVLLDFGGLGKGYMIDRIGAYLSGEGIANFCIDAGGDILYKNEKEKILDVGLEHPDNMRQVIGVAHILNKSICASAGNRRKWGKFHHIINPHTLQSPNHILATWVTADSALIADALATCLFLASPEKLIPHFTFEYCIVASDYKVACSKGFPVKFY